MKTTSNKNEVLLPGIVQVYEGSSLTLNWSYSLSAGLLGGVIRFDSDIVFRFKDGGAEPVETKFQERFGVASTRGRTSLFIFNVTVADDKVNGEFRCELVDSNAETWIRVIQVQVTGKLESVADCKKGVLKCSTLLFNSSLWAYFKCR